jgi:hypothetical protein
MEKLIYAVWSQTGGQSDAFRDSLLEGLGPVLLENGQVLGLRLAVVDSAVAQAASKRLSSCQPLPDGLVSLWLDKESDRAPLERAIAAAVGRFRGYRVNESEPLVNTAHPAGAGERVFGFCQVVFMRRPEWLNRDDWLSLWLGGHTGVAIDTQATFAYRQNVVEDALCDGASQFDAIVEESFPPEAMNSELAFYGAGDEEGLRANKTALIDSCARFIDFQRIDVIPMSEYVLKNR